MRMLAVTSSRNLSGWPSVAAHSYMPVIIMEQLISLLSFDLLCAEHDGCIDKYFTEYRD
jgi:hypothetical protein